MKAEIRFDQELKKFISMAFQIWPSLRLGLKHLHEVTQPKEHSFLPERSYNNMGEQQFIQTASEDFFDFIMTHDVKEQDLEDYLYDIIELLLIEEQLVGGSKNPASIQSMSKFIIKVIDELQNGSNSSIQKFEQEVYLNVKNFKGEVIEDKNNHQYSSQSEGNSDSDSCSEQEQKAVPQTNPNKKTAEEIQKQQQLEDDGWIIVKKK